MSKLKILIIIGIIIFIVGAFMLEKFISTPSLPYDKPVPHVALQIELEKVDNSVSLKNIDLVENFPEKPQEDYPGNYLEAQLLDSEGKLILKIRKPTTRLAMLDYVNPKQAMAPVEEKVVEFVYLLPYQMNAQMVTVRDDTGNILLSIKLKDYNLTKVNLYQDLCGNGICDSTENFISCRNDCSYQLKESINRLVP